MRNEMDQHDGSPHPHPHPHPHPRSQEIAAVTRSNTPNSQTTTNNKFTYDQLHQQTNQHQIDQYQRCTDLHIPVKEDEVKRNGRPKRLLDEEAKQQNELKGTPSTDPHWSLPGFAQQVGHTLVRGIGFLLDAYVLFIVSIVVVVLTEAYGATSREKSLISVAFLIGAIIGQLLFGIIADYLGRTKSFVATLSILTSGSVMSACAYNWGSLSLMYTFIIAQIVLGIGIGGEYPLSATISSEAKSDPRSRGRRIGSVFSMQSVGAVLAPTIIVIGFASTNNIDLVWRIGLAVAAVIGCTIIYFRVVAEESEHFATAHAPGVTTKEKHTHKWRDIKAYGKKLLGTSVTWFIFDIVFYANSLFSATIISRWYKTGDDTIPDLHHFLFQVALSTLYLSFITLPGYWVATFCVDLIGRRKLQLIGFAGMTATYALCGGLFDYMLKYQALFYILYGLSFFFSQGPNVTTYIIPSELFPTTIRASCHGISSASGKIGAVVGGAIMPIVMSASSLSTVMYISAGISALGLLWAFFFTYETMGQPLPHTKHHSGPTIQTNHHTTNDTTTHPSKKLTHLPSTQPNGPRLQSPHSTSPSSSSSSASNSSHSDSPEPIRESAAPSHERTNLYLTPPPSLAHSKTGDTNIERGLNQV